MYNWVFTTFLPFFTINNIKKKLFNYVGKNINLGWPTIKRI